MKRLASLVPFSLVFLLASCVGGGGGNKVEVLTEGALSPVSLEVVGGRDKGEFLIGSDAVIFEIKVKNSNSFRINNMRLTLDPLSTAAMKFEPTEDGKAKTPGASGTCSSTLSAGGECSYKLYYQPTFGGHLAQKFTFDYQNLVRSERISGDMVMLAGEAASLVFESEVISYDYGVMERTEPVLKRTDLTITNVGGLTARSMNFGQITNPIATDAFSVPVNTCSSSLPMGQSCNISIEFIPQNYGPTAPDGNITVMYSNTLRFDYVREPNGGTSALSAFFNAESTTIEGELSASGIKDLTFSTMTVGNREQKTIKVQNYGYKEAIIHGLDIVDDSDNVVARCFDLGDAQNLTCQDPNDVGPSGANLSLADIPLKIVDTDNCVNSYSQLGYSRDVNGFLSDPTLKEVAGRTKEEPGESCFFNVTFWPSISNTTGGNINDLNFRFYYDSTWKNGIVMKGGTPGDPSQFSIFDAGWTSAAKISVDEFEFGNLPYSDLLPGDDTTFLYDQGRVSLISDPSYSLPLEVVFVNSGETLAEVVSVTDGNSFTFTNLAQSINDYYFGATHIGCDYLGENGGDCKIKMNVAPVASANPNAAAAQQEENENMFDVTDAYPDQYKKFIFTYKDGTTYNDDGSVREDRVVEVLIRSLLVRKGFLVYSSGTSAGTSPIIIGNNEEYFHLKLKNAGTGGIPYIATISNLKVIDESTVGTILDNNMRPYIYVDRPTNGEDGADKDCYDLLTANENVPPGVAPATNATSILDAGQECTLSIRYKKRSVDIETSGYYSQTDDKWSRFYDGDFQSTEALWMTLQDNRSSTYNSRLHFKYYDGDGIGDPGNGYTPDLNGYGNYHTIAGGDGTGDYRVEGRWRSQAIIYPDDALPAISGVICRNRMMLPTVNPKAGEWGNPVGAWNSNRMCRDYNDGKSGADVSHYQVSQSYIGSNYGNESYDYLFHAGKFIAGKTYELSVVLYNNSYKSAKVITETYPDNASTFIDKQNSLGVGSNFSGSRTIRFEFTPPAAGDYEEDYIIEYENGLTTINNVNTLARTNNQVTFRLKILAQAVDSNVADLSATVQDYIVEYTPDGDGCDTEYEDEDNCSPDNGTGDFSSVADGAPRVVNLHSNKIDEAQTVDYVAIKGSKIYDKKVFTFTNDGVDPINDLYFHIKRGIDDTQFSDHVGGRGMKVFENDCLNINLAPAASCDVTLIFDASKTEPKNLSVVGNLIYKVDATNYQQSNFAIEFLAKDPARLDILTINDIIIADEVGSPIQNSYPLDLGNYSNSGPINHAVISSFPNQAFRIEDVVIVNLSEEKASFLAQWASENGVAPLPGGAWITIYDNAGKVVEANRACFYGDDESDVLVPANQKGFNKDTISECKMNFEVVLDDTYFGEEMNTAETYFDLDFYNSERTSLDQMNFHFSGFVEPNRSVKGSNDYLSVTSTEDGVINLTWDPATPANASWGVIEGYRVFYSATKSPLNNIFTTSATSKDTAVPAVSITGLVPGKYYYIEVYAIRDSGGVEYISDMGFARRTIPVPPEDHFYDYDLKVIVAKDRTNTDGGFGSKSEAMSACSKDSLILSINGSNKVRTMNLIDSDVYSLFEEDEDNSNYTYFAIPHWLADPSEDIEPYFADFDCSESTGQGVTPNDNFYYSKSCTDCSCHVLDRLYGGDGDELPLGGFLFVNGEDFSGVFRCYANQ